jgi:hypothetical protein
MSQIGKERGTTEEKKSFEICSYIQDKICFWRFSQPLLR